MKKLLILTLVALVACNQQIFADKKAWLVNTLDSSWTVTQAGSPIVANGNQEMSVGGVYYVAVKKDLGTFENTSNNYVHLKKMSRKCVKQNKKENLPYHAEGFANITIGASGVYEIVLGDESKETTFTTKQELPSCLTRTNAIKKYLVKITKLSDDDAKKKYPDLKY